MIQERYQASNIPKPVRDPAEASWIQEWFSWTGGVRNLVGTEYSSYTRIFHPWGLSYDTMFEASGQRWSEVADHYGLAIRPDSISREIQDLQRDGHGDIAPLIGELAPKSLSRLTRILSSFTTTPDNCFFGVWTGWGWVQSSEMFPLKFTGGLDLRAAKFSVPHRDYLLYEGPVAQANCLISGPIHANLYWQSPSYMWPSDRSWCLATEVDADWTVVGGSRKLGLAIAEDPHLEAMAIDGNLVF